ncbi:MAG: hypothetical protein NWE76_08635, partial [Candidatus Bathyarchaeota archaeon]|nr:hypothetical protein [Candidatus Bathyarchaeota archaeon]
QEISRAVDALSFVKAHNAKGGPSPEEVSGMLKSRRGLLSAAEGWISAKMMSLEEAERVLNTVVGSCVEKT